MKLKFPVESLKSYMDIAELGEQEVIRKQYNISNIKIDEEDTHTVIADVSVESIDAEGDLVISKGVDLSRFIKFPNVYVNHNYAELPCATATEIEVLDKSIRLKYKIADTPICNEIWQRVKQGVVKGNSIGFIIKKALIRGTKEFKSFVEEKMLQIDDRCQRIITDYLLLENSICGMPCNADASNIAVSTKNLVIKEEGDEYLESKPYPNEHAFRINSPDKYKRFRRTNNKFGEGIHAIWGVTEDGTVELQAIRFDATTFTYAEASKWIKDNNYSPISSEPASKEEDKAKDKEDEECKEVSKVAEVVKVEEVKEEVKVIKAEELPSKTPEVKIPKVEVKRYVHVIRDGNYKIEEIKNTYKKLGIIKLA